MDGLYIMIGGARYKRMQDKRKKYKYPITPESGLKRKFYMRRYRSAKRKNEVDLLLDIELAVGGEAAPPGYDTAAEPNLSVSEMCEPDSVRTSGQDSQNGDNDTSGWQQNVLSID
jgi:hypothetical protein